MPITLTLNTFAVCKKPESLILPSDRDVRRHHVGVGEREGGSHCWQRPVDRYPRRALDLQGRHRAAVHGYGTMDMEGNMNKCHPANCFSSRSRPVIIQYPCCVLNNLQLTSPYSPYLIKKLRSLTKNIPYIFDDLIRISIMPQFYVKSKKLIRCYVTPHKCQFMLE